MHFTTHHLYRCPIKMSNKIRHAYRERQLTFQNFLQSLNFLFSEAKSFKFFFTIMQGWVGGNFSKLFLSYWPCLCSPLYNVLHMTILLQSCVVSSKYSISYPKVLAMMSISFNCLMNKWFPLFTCMVPLTPCFGVYFPTFLL